MSTDLPVRVVSAVVMTAIAGTAIWLGGWILAGFVAVIGLGLLYEWVQLSRAIAGSPLALWLWLLVGLVYIGAACLSIVALGAWWAIAPIVLVVIATDSCAYFAGRAIGGPKIAPTISPSKTWAGLAGGMAGAAAVAIACYLIFAAAIDRIGGTPAGLGAHARPAALSIAAAIGALLAIVAQAGDFFESWMKRRAGVKDSGALIPGHGGLLDRLDGLMPALIVFTAGAVLLGR